MLHRVPVIPARPPCPGRDLADVAVTDVHYRRILKNLQLRLDLVRRENVMAVEQLNEAAAGSRDTTVVSGGPVQVWLPDEAHPAGIKSRHLVAGLVGGTVVHDDHLDVPVRLIECAFDRDFEIGPVVVSDDYN